MFLSGESNSPTDLWIEEKGVPSGWFDEPEPDVVEVAELPDPDDGVDVVDEPAPALDVVEWFPWWCVLVVVVWSALGELEHAAANRPTPTRARRRRLRGFTTAWDGMAATICGSKSLFPSGCSAR
jgi:hypothetical protein